MESYPVQFEVDYPERPLDRLTTFFRILTVIPIMILVGAVVGFSTSYSGVAGESTSLVISGVGLLFLPALLMILFRGKYPRWWFDWNLNLLRFLNRVAVYALLMDDRYPSTDESQGVTLELEYPNVEADLNRGLPLVKWILAIPHYIVLAVLHIGVVFAVIVAWFAILFTGSFPRGIFDFIEGVLRWHNRVIGYAFVLTTDRYPPFRLGS